MPRTIAYEAKPELDIDAGVLEEELNRKTVVPALPSEGALLKSLHFFYGKTRSFALTGNGVKAGWALIHELGTELVSIDVYTNVEGFPEEKLGPTEWKWTNSTLTFTVPPAKGVTYYVKVST
jgi:hypothetical protein